MERVHLVLITGLSGAGKSNAIQVMEDFGYFCVDNLPPTFIPKFAEICYQSDGKISNVALVCDIRGGDFFPDLYESIDKLEEMGVTYEILYLEASVDVLLRRYKETRRRHPLAIRGSIAEKIKEEKKMLEKLRRLATKIIDTSNLTPNELKSELISLFSSESKKKDSININLVSFGFKHGVPLDSDLVFDVRFLPNPHYVSFLRPLTGHDGQVKEYVWRWEITNKFYEKFKDLILFLIPCYLKEGKSHLVISIGCTGGRHRSVAITNELEKELKKNNYNVVSEHRDTDK